MQSTFDVQQQNLNLTFVVNAYGSTPKCPNGEYILDDVLLQTHDVRFRFSSHTSAVIVVQAHTPFGVHTFSPCSALMGVQDLYVQLTLGESKYAVVRDGTPAKLQLRELKPGAVSGFIIMAECTSGDCMTSASAEEFRWWMGLLIGAGAFLVIVVVGVIVVVVQRTTRSKYSTIQ